MHLMYTSSFIIKRTLFSIIFLYFFCTRKYFPSKIFFLTLSNEELTWVRARFFHVFFLSKEINIRVIFRVRDYSGLRVLIMRKMDVVLSLAIIISFLLMICTQRWLRARRVLMAMKGEEPRLRETFKKPRAEEAL